MGSCTILHGLTIITWNVISINHIESFEDSIHALGDVMCFQRFAENRLRVAIKYFFKLGAVPVLWAFKPFARSNLKDKLLYALDKANVKILESTTYFGYQISAPLPRNKDAAPYSP